MCEAERNGNVKERRGKVFWGGVSKIGFRFVVKSCQETTVDITETDTAHICVDMSQNQAKKGLYSGIPRVEWRIEHRQSHDQFTNIFNWLHLESVSIVQFRKVAVVLTRQGTSFGHPGPDLRQCVNAIEVGR